MGGKHYESSFSQLQFAITQAEYEKIYSKVLSVESLPAKKIAGRITKTLTNIPIPRIGESVCDSYWPRDFSEQKIINICYDYFDDCCYAYLEPFFIIEGSTLHTDLKKIAEHHNWEYSKM